HPQPGPPGVAGRGGAGSADTDQGVVPGRFEHRPRVHLRALTAASRLARRAMLDRDGHVAAGAASAGLRLPAERGLAIIRPLVHTFTTGGLMSGQRDVVVGVLRQVPLFSEVPEAELQQIADMAVTLRRARNQIVFDEGDPGDFLLVLTNGRAKVVLVGEG